MAKHKTTQQQLEDAEERLKRLRERQRQQTTRQRILVGAMYIGRAKNDPAAHHKLMCDLDVWLTAKRDRKLFDLGPIRGLYGAKFKTLSKEPGWWMGISLKRVPVDRYGNLLDRNGNRVDLQGNLNG